MARVLVVEDDPVILDLVVLNFELEGHEVLTAVNGGEAMTLTLEQEPDAVVLDVMLPGRSGFDVCEALRDDPRTSRIPVVLLSARALRQDVERGLAAGAAEYVTKPFDPLALVELVERLVREDPAGP